VQLTTLLQLPPLQLQLCDTAGNLLPLTPVQLQGLRVSVALQHSSGAKVLEQSHPLQGQLHQQAEGLKLVLPAIKQALAAAGTYSLTFAVRAAPRPHPSAAAAAACWRGRQHLRRRA
jgi:hypothetical protein